MRFNHYLLVFKTFLRPTRRMTPFRLFGPRAYLTKSSFPCSPTQVAIFDHITCASAVCFPVQRLARICRDNNVMSIVDGAHAPGQLHLDLESYGVDVYIG